ncbi:DUF2617 family protein [Streptomyces sp. NPDC005438]|uniref:DUF2617 family protein n=1 Tax=Streptomyces sp. NPDC005438 TaxID=3156880 RepID=UPI0033B3137C
MLTTLTTAYSDTRAGDLTWALGREPLPCLALLNLQLGAQHVQLRLLGASHQVLVHGDNRVSETVACMPGSNAPLPMAASQRIGGWEYEFSARIESLSAGSFLNRARGLFGMVSEHPQGLAGVFPGSPYAFTALIAQRQQEVLTWRTWHSYPQDRQLVSTRTRVNTAR